MDKTACAVIAFFAFVTIVRAIAFVVKKATAEGQAAQRGVGQPQARPASGSELVRRFLEEMAQQRGRQGGGEQVQLAEPVVEQLLPQEEPAREQPVILGHEDLVAAPRARAKPTPARPEAARATRRRKRRVAAPKQAAAVSAAPTAAPPRLTVAAPLLPHSDLKKAVVWAEILGAPVSLRGRAGHRPPSAGGR